MTANMEFYKKNNEESGVMASPCHKDKYSGGLKFKLNSFKSTFPIQMEKSIHQLQPPKKNTFFKIIKRNRNL